MLLVVGLGNPGKKYERTRHNLGFRVADALRDAFGFPDYREKFSGLFARGEIAKKPASLLKPTTFMNLSGKSVAPAMTFLKIPVEGIVAVHDELDLPLGTGKIKVGGGHGGHNGLRSLLELLPGSGFARIRLGVGRPPPGYPGDVADFLLSEFRPDEIPAVDTLVRFGQEAVVKIAEAGVGAAMNVMNGPALAK